MASASCTGSFVPFAANPAGAGRDGRPAPLDGGALPDKEAYVAAVKRAAGELVGQRFLLQEDADRLVAEAERDGVRSGP